MKTKAELRIEIAKDVLKHIKAKNIIVKSWTYFEASNLDKYVGLQLKKVLPKLKKCTVCALGGLFYSYVKRYNDFVLHSDGHDGVEIKDYQMRDVMEIFTDKQLYLIETAFEGKDVNWNQCSRNTNFAESTILRAVNYRLNNGLQGVIRGQNGDEALIHIMKNIIKHGGTFKP